MENKYKNYFKSHYRSALTEKDIFNYGQWFFSQLNIIRSKVKVKKNGKILEIGSGFGGFYNLLSEAEKKHYMGIELDIDATNFANEYFHTNVFKNKSLESLCGYDLVDRIFAFEVLEHLNNPLESIEKIHSLLNDKGIFIGTSPYPFLKNITGDKTHTFVLHPENWKRLFLNSGFREVEVIPMSFFPYIWRTHKLLNIRLPFYVSFPFFVSTTLIIAKK